MVLAAGPLNIINLSNNGTFTASGQLQTRPEDVDAIFQHLRENDLESMVLFFHGGRVSEVWGKATADNLMPLIVERVGAHPVFFIWESSELEIIRGNLDKIAAEPIFGRLVNQALSFVLGKLEGAATRSPVEAGVREARVQEQQLAEARGMGEVPEDRRPNLKPVSADEEQAFKDQLESDPVFQQEARKIADLVASNSTKRGAAAGAGAETVESTMLSEDLLRQMREQEAGGGTARGLVSTGFLISTAVGVLKRTVERLIRKSDHGLHCTVVEEVLRQFYGDKVGKFIWDGMKNETRDAFNSNEGLSGQAMHGGRYFLERLRDYVSGADARPLRVSLVGHSAGAIYVCRLLEKANELMPAGFKFGHVVFLAPAVDFDLFKATVVDHPERCEAFRMYTMLDEFERQDSLIPGEPLIYPRSLLYFVSGLLEGDQDRPIVGMERYYSKQAPYDTQPLIASADFINAQDKARVVWSVAANKSLGLNSNAQNHGGYAAEPVTQDSLAHLLKS